MRRIVSGWCMLLTVAAIARGQGAGLEFRVLDDIAKPTRDLAEVQSSPTVFDGAKIVLKGAGNEVVAFQLFLQAQEKVTNINVRIATFDSKIQPQCELFLEFYQKILRGGYAEVFPGRKDRWQGVLSPFDLFNIPTRKFRVLKLPKLQREGIPLDWPTTKDLEKDPGFFGRYN